MNVLLDPFGTSVQTKPNPVTEFPEADNLDATKPSMFQGIGEALSDIPGYAAYSSLSSLNSAIAVRTESLYDMENQEDPFAEDFALKRPDKETAVKAIEDQAKYYRLKAKNEYMPSAEDDSWDGINGPPGRNPHNAYRQSLFGSGKFRHG